MATLVLSTVGNALGGPVGSAIGALIGQSVDQALLAPVRRGPRVGDLSVQTSSYGTQIPRIYGKMRVAGTVVWATDLVESEQASGAKGQPDIAYGYSVSLAVALSSRPAKAVGRIWADGKLLRGAAGDFKVDTEFRFHDGSEDQVIDPLIGSVEGLAAATAYRGIALAVFENLQLGPFGNRIPMMTFEVIADDGPLLVGPLISDASAGAIVSAAADPMIGFAAYGHSIRDAVEPLIECFGLELSDDGESLKSPASSAPVAVSSDLLGNSADGKQAPRIEREQVQARDLPSRLRLTYYEPARDYQTGEAQAVASERVGAETRHDLPAVVDASEAKAIAHTMVGRIWSNRDRLTLRLPPSMLGLEPGGRLELALSPPQWCVEKTTVDSFVVVAEMRPASAQGAAMTGDSGRIVGNPDVIAQPVTIALFDVPSSFSGVSNEPTLLLAGTSPSGWQRKPVTISFGGQSITIEPPHTKSVLGHIEGPFAAGSTDLIDMLNSVTVALIDKEQWLTSCDDAALAAGENLAMIGSELIQFGNAISLGGGRFRLSRLLRGRGGTEWACAGHSADEQFCLLRAGTVQAVAMPDWAVGATVSATTQGGSAASILFAGESVRPPTPVNLAAEHQASGDLVLSWTRRSRQGFAWLDGIDAPLGESSEQYRVTLAGGSESLELLATETTLTVAAADVAGLGAGPLTIEVRQIGDVAVSRPARLTLS